MPRAAGSRSKVGHVTDDVTPKGLKARLDRHEPVVLLDVREHWEAALCRLEHSIHIPIEELEHRTDELDSQEEIVVYCHHGVRSAAVADYLRGLGFARVKNLDGGLDGWARDVDPEMRRY